MSRWYLQPAPQQDVAVSTRIRLARNLEGLPFPSRMTAEQRAQLNARVRDAILESHTPFAKSLKYIEMKNVPATERRAMVERHIISPEFIASPKENAVILSDDETVCVMIGEEDHLRIQVLAGGLQLESAYDTAAQLDALLCDRLHFAFDRKLGFLTECPTNLGTGLRASVMLHLPLCESSGLIGEVSESVSKIGFTVRGMYGEGSAAEASLYQISNQITLGISEKNALDNLKIVAMQLCEKERNLRDKLNPGAMEDLCMRAVGTLKYARKMGSKEMMKLLSAVILGQNIGLLPKTEADPIRLLIECQPNMLMHDCGELTADERDCKRAEQIRRAFEKL